MTRRRIAHGALLAAMALVVAGFTPDRAAGADPPAVLELGASQRDDGAWMLTATLTRAGAVQSQQAVEFLQSVEFFGDRLVPLGSAITDAAGIASRLYSPTANGVQVIVARHAAADGTFTSEPIEITVVGATPAIPEAEPVLPIVRAWAFPVGALILAMVWLALAVILLRALIGIARSQPGLAAGGGPQRAGPNSEAAQEPKSRE